MKRLERPRDYRLDIDPVTGERIADAYDGPVAVLVGPGALSAGDLSAFWMTFPRRVYLTHREFPVDEPVWLRPADAAHGVDTVVERALQWLRHHRR